MTFIARVRIMATVLPRALALSLLIACSGTRPTQACGECDWGRFRALDHQQKQASLRGCSPEEKVDLFLKWSFYTIPANNDLVDTMASFGRSIVPEIMSRVERAGELQDDLVKPELLFVLVRMQDLGSYAVSADSDLMKRLESAVAAIQDSALREAAEENLGWLRGPDGRSHRSRSHDSPKKELP